MPPGGIRTHGSRLRGGTRCSCCITDSGMNSGDHDLLPRSLVLPSIALASAPSLPGSLALPIHLPSSCSRLATAARSPTSSVILIRFLLTPTKIILVPSSSSPDSSHALNLSRSRSVNR